MGVIEEKQIEVLHAYGQLLISRNKNEQVEEYDEKRVEIERKKREDKKNTDILALTKQEDDFDFGERKIMGYQ